MKYIKNDFRLDKRCGACGQIYFFTWPAICQMLMNCEKGHSIYVISIIQIIVLISVVIQDVIEIPPTF